VVETAAGPAIGAAVTPDGSRAVAWTPAGAAAKPAVRVVSTPFGPVAEVAEVEE
jgi:hypothetical protein